MNKKLEVRQNSDGSVFIEEYKKPIYEIGNDKPIYIAKYTTLSYLDYQVTFDKKPISACQSFKTKKTKDSTTGELSFIKFIDSNCNSDINKEFETGGLIGNKYRLKVIGSDTDGNTDVLIDENIEFVSYETGISVDDLVTEYTYDFKVINE